MCSDTSDAGSDLDIYHAANAYQSDDQLVIALDFGTTFSGIAYAFTKEDKPELTSILDWPVSTVICYGPKGDSSFTWGAQTHKHEIIRGMKLLFDPTQDKPVYPPFASTGNDLRLLGKPALDVAADFIGAMYEHAMTVIEDKIPKDYLEMCQKQFVLSVPAVWSDKAKDLTLMAAKRAKIHPVTLIKEPEAAALYMFHTLKERALSVGDAFVICDAGGGTVDLISYEITQLAPKLELKELVPGKGTDFLTCGMAGSLGLNMRFEEAVRELVGEKQFRTLRTTRGFRSAVEQFDLSVKTAFRDQEDEDFFLNFPMAKLRDNTNKNLVSNCWNMKCDDLKRIFDPLIADIQRMVDDQINLVKTKRMSEGHPTPKEIKAIFLVGGFGSSGYLKSRIGACHPNIQIIQPHDAWSAIVKGAVLSGLPHKTCSVSVVSTQSTRHYGVVTGYLYDEEIYRGRPTYVDCYGDTRTSKMTWYIYRGEDLKRDQKIRFPFYRALEGSVTDRNLIFTETLLQCESADAPIYPGPTITPNCTLEADLRSVDRATFRARTSLLGTPCWDVHFDLVVTVASAVMKFSLEVNGEEMGSVEANNTDQIATLASLKSEKASTKPSLIRRCGDAVEEHFTQTANKVDQLYAECKGLKDRLDVVTRESNQLRVEKQKALGDLKLLRVANEKQIQDQQNEIERFKSRTHKTKEFQEYVQNTSNDLRSLQQDNTRLRQKLEASEELRKRYQQQAARIRDMIQKRDIGQDMNDSVITAQFRKLRDQIHRIVCQYYTTAFPPPEPNETDTTFVKRYYDWCKLGLDENELKTRVRAFVFRCLSDSVLLRPSFGISVVDGSDEKDMIENGLVKFEEMIEKYSKGISLHRAYQVERMITLKVAQCLQPTDSTLPHRYCLPIKTASDILQLLKPLEISRPEPATANEAERSKLQVKWKQLCTDAFKLTMMLGNHKDVYRCEFPTEGEALKDADAEPWVEESTKHEGKKAESKEHIVAYALSGALVRYPADDLYDKIVLEKAWAVSSDPDRKNYSQDYVSSSSLLSESLYETRKPRNGERGDSFGELSQHLWSVIWWSRKI
ncbi:hypothetical protein SBOR_6503 [Sclerotinia borealis F-4128]|uniref:Uncharacterized protein n=1 Tax=Sclerotinia borealis (strain F-4128) TaxID=1432307 RepID=W9CBA0_SCLBF|nr:hypothetical protein SBOR_6503 [Sclerotinia borealis F-4128]